MRHFERLNAELVNFRLRPAPAGRLVALSAALVVLGLSPAVAQEPSHPLVLGNSGAGLPLRAVITARSTVTVDRNRCPELTVNATGVGFFTGIGKVSDVESFCISSRNPLEFRNGRFVETTENGDTIHGVFGGRLIRTPTTDIDKLYLLDAAQEITGGTGRLRGVTGGTRVSGFTSFATGDAVIILDGHIEIPKN